jgi:hypothetical protein
MTHCGWVTNVHWNICYSGILSRLQSLTHVGKHCLSSNQENTLEYTVPFVADRLGYVHVSGAGAMKGTLNFIFKYSNFIFIVVTWYLFVFGVGVYHIKHLWVKCVCMLMCVKDMHSVRFLIMDTLQQ